MHWQAEAKLLRQAEQDALDINEQLLAENERLRDRIAQAMVDDAEQKAQLERLRALETLNE